MDEEITADTAEDLRYKLGIPAEEFQTMDEQLYLLLAQKTSSQVLTTVKNLKSEGAGRGIRAWHRI